MSSPAPMVSNAEKALTIASVVAAAFPPPWGPVASAATGVVGDVLSYFFPVTSSGPTLAQIVGAVSQQFANAGITVASNNINATLSKFQGMTTNSTNTPLPKSVEQALRTDPEGSFAQLYNFLEGVVMGGGVSALSVPIASMATEANDGDICTIDGNLQAAYLSTFAFGVSVYLLITTYWVALATAVDGANALAKEKISLNVPINLLSETLVAGQHGWINYATYASSSFLSLVQARLANVSQATPFNTNLTRYIDGVYFADSGESVSGFNPSGLGGSFDVAGQFNRVFGGWVPWPGNYPLADVPDAPNAKFAVTNPKDTQAQTNAVEGVRNQYVNLLATTLDNNYFAPASMTSTVQAWVKGLTKLQIATPR